MSTQSLESGRGQGRPLWARLAGYRPNAITYGVVAAVLAVGVQVLLSVKPPPAYGICTACHPRDMMNWLINHLFGTRFEVAPVSAGIPLLTTVGMLLGAFAAARRHGEFRLLNLGHRLRGLVLGVLVMSAAMLVLGCPTRVLLLSAYGDVLGLIGLGGLVVGIVAGTYLLKKGIVD